MAKIIDPIEQNNQEMHEQMVAANHNARQQLPIPDGYIRIELSSNGQLGAPKVFHVRNFDTADLMNLALTEDEEIIEKVAKMIDNLIWEKNVSILNFHQDEVIELLIRHYQAFYSNELKDIEFPYTEEDLDYLRQNLSEAEYQDRVWALKNKKWVPRVTISIANLETYDLPENFKSTVSVVNNKTGFSVKFSFPRYGDMLILKNFIKKEFGERDKQFSQMIETLKFRRDAEERVRKGEDINLSKIPNIPEAEKQKIKEYEEEKAVYTAHAIKALHLVEFNGKDLRNEPLKVRMQYAQDPRIDLTIMKKVNDFYQNMNVGLQKEIEMLNPIKGVVERRRYTFRLVDILQAIKLYDSDDYSIDVE